MLRSLQYVPHEIALLQEIEALPKVAGLNMSFSGRTKNYYLEKRDLGLCRVLTGLEIKTSNTALIAGLCFWQDPVPTIISVIHLSASDSWFMMWWNENDPAFGDNLQAGTLADWNSVLDAANVAQHFGLMSGATLELVDKAQALSTLDRLIDFASGLAIRNGLHA